MESCIVAIYVAAAAAGRALGRAISAAVHGTLVLAVWVALLAMGVVMSSRRLLARLRRPAKPRHFQIHW